MNTAISKAHTLKDTLAKSVIFYLKTFSLKVASYISFRTSYSNLWTVKREFDCNLTRSLRFATIEHASSTLHTGICIKIVLQESSTVARISRTFWKAPRTVVFGIRERFFSFSFCGFLMILVDHLRDHGGLSGHQFCSLFLSTRFLAQSRSANTAKTGSSHPSALGGSCNTQ